MKKKSQFLGIIIIPILLTNCNKILFREISCKSFKLNEEYYWFPQKIGDSVVFSNSINVKKKFIVKEKSINHRTSYITDNGCGCLDISIMLLTSKTDSIWFKNQVKYLEKQEGNEYEDLVFTLEGTQSVFFETHKTILANYTIDNISFSNVEKFEYNYQNSSKVKTVYCIKNLGIIRFEMVNGEVWTNQNLTNYITTSYDSFTHSENKCD